MLKTILVRKYALNYYITSKLVTVSLLYFLHSFSYGIMLLKQKSNSCLAWWLIIDIFVFPIICKMHVTQNSSGFCFLLYHTYSDSLFHADSEYHPFTP
jgi:hypothetical protein